MHAQMQAQGNGQFSISCVGACVCICVEVVHTCLDLCLRFCLRRSCEPAFSVSLPPMVCAFVCETSVQSVILSKVSFTKHSGILYFTTDNKCTILTPSCSRPQFPGSFLGTPGPMNPHLATKFDIRERPCAF